jgi:hypothetical protein
MPTMMRNCQHLNDAFHFAIDKCELEATQPYLADVGWAGQLESMRRVDRLANSLQHLSVIPEPKISTVPS